MVRLYEDDMRTWGNGTCMCLHTHTCIYVSATQSAVWLFTSCITSCWGFSSGQATGTASAVMPYLWPIPAMQRQHKYLHLCCTACTGVHVYNSVGLMQTVCIGPRVHLDCAVICWHYQEMGRPWNFLLKFTLTVWQRTEALTLSSLYILEYPFDLQFTNTAKHCFFC